MVSINEGKNGLGNTIGQQLDLIPIIALQHAGLTKSPPPENPGSPPPLPANHLPISLIPPPATPGNIPLDGDGASPPSPGCTSPPPPGGTAPTPGVKKGVNI